MSMKLLLCLGNFGAKYELTRHNMGFMLADNFAIKHGINFKLESKFKSEVAQGFIDNEKVLVAKPQTYMNLSGEALSLLKSFYKIETKDILVVYDDISLPIGKMRFREKGSDGGHNGIKSVINHIGGQEFDRMKLGIGPQPERIKSESFVLQNFSNEQIEIINQSMPKFIEAVEFWLKTNDFKLLQSKYNG